jgi:hypothetical protein
LSSQALKLLRVLLFERLNCVGRHRVGQLGLKRSNERSSICEWKYESGKGSSNILKRRVLSLPDSFSSSLFRS